jgi:formylglycine-generating enzyme required for sulfatase activity
VSWFEATAYCAWLSAQWGREVFLPTEALWQRAAGAEEGRTYPWGSEEPGPEQANFGGGVGSPSPVGIYPASNGPFGHCDLAGNVWEWCLDTWPGDQLSEAWYWDSGGGRALRGGGWFGSVLRLQAAFRRRYPAWERSNDIGFRIAAAPTSLGT